ncbi:MAG: class II fructose-bisphosphate aldolase [Patescibacteria group bacterium]
MLSGPRAFLYNAMKGAYAVGAFNFSNLETLQGIINAAEIERSPVIIQTSQGALAYGGMNTLCAMAIAEAKRVSVPIAIHLDHGTSVAIVKEAIASGFYTSVMIDASRHSFKENVKITSEIVALAHKKNIWVEAELGPIPGSEDTLSVKDRDAYFTDPKLVAIFVKETGADALAISIGTKHGLYKFDDKVAIDFKRLAEIRAVAKVPLVLHGASAIPETMVKKAKTLGAHIEGAKGVSDGQMKKAIAHGISKVNIDSDLRMAFTIAVDEYRAKFPSNLDPRAYLGDAREAITRLVRQKIRLFGSNGKT